MVSSTSQRFLWVFQIVLAIFLLLFVILLSIVFSLYVITKSSSYFSKSLNEEESGEKWNEYQALWYDSSNEEFTFGSSSIPQTLSEGEYIFSSLKEEMKEDKYLLLSQFGEEEYICTGNCYCDEENNISNRRLGTTPIHHASRQILTYLLVSVSLSTAYTLSKNYFEETCVNELHDTCSDPSYVKSEVSDCENVVYSAAPRTTSYSSSSSVRKDGEKSFKYKCSGTCNFNDGHDFGEFFHSQKHKEYKDLTDKKKGYYRRLTEKMYKGATSREDCENMELKGVSVHIDAFGEDKWLTKDKLKEVRLEVKRKFHPVLKKFCEENSVMDKKLKEEVVQILVDAYEKKEEFPVGPIPSTWCTAEYDPGIKDYSFDREYKFIEDDPDPDFDLETIKCRKQGTVLTKNIKEVEL